MSQLQIIHCSCHPYSYHHSSYCVLCFIKLFITKIRLLIQNLLNQNFECTEVCFFYWSSSLVTTCVVKVEHVRYIWIPVVADFPMSDATAFSLSR